MAFYLSSFAANTSSKNRSTQAAELIVGENFVQRGPSAGYRHRSHKLRFWYSHLSRAVLSITCPCWIVHSFIHMYITPVLSVSSTYHWCFDSHLLRLSCGQFDLGQITRPIFDCPSWMMTSVNVEVFLKQTFDDNFLIRQVSSCVISCSRWDFS